MHSLKQKNKKQVWEDVHQDNICWFNGSIPRCCWECALFFEAMGRSELTGIFPPVFMRGFVVTLSEGKMLRWIQHCF